MLAGLFSLHNNPDNPREVIPLAEGVRRGGIIS